MGSVPNWKRIAEVAAENGWTLDYLRDKPRVVRLHIPERVLVEGPKDVVWAYMAANRPSATEPEAVSDGVDALCRAVYRRDPRPGDYLGGSQARMLYDAANALAAAERELVELRGRIRGLHAQACEHADATCQGEAQRYAGWLREAFSDLFPKATK